MPTEDPLLNKYSLVKGAARRARQLQSGAQPKVSTTSTKACRVAQDEISEGRVTFVVNHAPKVAVAVEPSEPDDSDDEE